MNLRLLATAVLLALAVAACGEEEPAAAPGDATEATEAAGATDEATDDATDDAATDDATDDAATDDHAAAGAATVATADTDLGEVLVDSEGRTLYLFDRDEGGESACYDDCAELWPPLVTEGEPHASDGADGGLLGTTERDDGTTQVTYDGQPLYHYAPDTGPGDVQGQGVGDVWWVVDPSGEAVTDSAEQASGGNPYDY